MKPLFAIAPNFQCKGAWTDRLLVAEGSGWRKPLDDELPSLTVSEPSGEARCQPAYSPFRHTCAPGFGRCWRTKQKSGVGDFVEFSIDLANFLTFKNLPPPNEPVCELLIQDTGGSLSTSDAWALINVGEEPVLLAWSQHQLRLVPGEGCRLAADLPPVVVPPAQDELNVVLAIRLAPSVT